MFGAAHASHESQTGGNRRTGPAESGALCPRTGHVSSLRSVVLLAGTCSVPALLRCSQAGLQESLRCFFCSWYSVIFCWKYAVDEEKVVSETEAFGLGRMRGCAVRVRPGSRTVLVQLHPGEMGGVAIPPLPVTYPTWASLCWVNTSTLTPTLTPVQFLCFLSSKEERKQETLGM